MDDCVFCKVVRGEIPAEKIDETDNFIVINDANPVADGHCLIIVRNHFENIYELPSDLGGELIELIGNQGKRLVEEGKADGVKIVQNNGSASGQTVLHFHTHVIPEKADVEREKHV
tara:strand:+ start:347 stop:694 length:348 start_codon:yes stop_codon:yes gene_type:complete